MEEEGGDLWGKLVELTQTAFLEGEMVEEAMWQTVVLIPKGKKEYRGIGLVKVTWKVVAAILHLRLTTAITYHDALHGFRAGRGTGTATLEAKLLQQLAAMREEVLYVIFLYLTKAYDALDRSRSLDILEGIRGGTMSETAAAGVLEKIHDGGKGGRVLRDRIQGRAGRDTGQPNVTHHLQCGGGCGGPPPH